LITGGGTGIGAAVAANPPALMGKAPFALVFQS